ncbi:hypothetical protein C8J57DRAFT_1545209 [Mycena rebaudengoi]|nr:hypothetical protein C8J57DRAFT_1546026 [Mycena rebaudengoi]KAJ7199281.1 hypothetical protein C8J57DRAFT_1545209 [Mycena rebaudengoi]
MASLSPSLFGIDRLVDDVLLACLFEALGSPHGDYVQYIRRRASIIGVSRRIRDLVYTSATLWSRVVVTPHVPIKVLKLWIERAREAPLHVEVLLEGAEFFYRFGDQTPTERLCLYSIRVIALLLPRIPFWSTFRLVVDNAVASAFFLRVLSSQRADMLQRVEFSCDCPIYGTSVLRSVPASVLPPQFFGHGVPALTHISLSVLGLHWRSFPSLPRLEFLEISEISFRCLPRFADYRRILQGARNLKHLVLRGVYLDPVDLSAASSSAGILPHCFLPSLEILVLDFQQSASMGRLVGAFDMPRLKKVDLCIHDYLLEGFVVCVDNNPAIFRNVEILVLNGDVECDVGVDVVAGSIRLFQHFTSVVQLDFLRVSPVVFECLADTVASSPSIRAGVLLPALKHIVLGQFTIIQTLKEFIAMRMEPGFCITRVDLDQTLMQLSDAVFQASLESVKRDVMLHLVQAQEDRFVTRLTYAERDGDLLAFT